MRLVDRIAAMFEGLTMEDVQQMPPVQRRRFADLCRHWADKADQPRPRKAGILSELANGRETD